MQDKIYRKFTDFEVHEAYDVKIKEYANGHIELIEYEKTLIRKKSGYELSTKQPPTPEIRLGTGRKQKTDGKFRLDSISRTYGLLVDLALENAKDFKNFITLTFAENITDLDTAHKYFTTWNKSIRRVFPDFKYLGVPEFQKRGAVHYHLLTNIPMNELGLIYKQPGKENMYDVKYWNHGFTSVFDLDLTDDNFSVAAYMTKYFYKDISSKLFGRRKILKSQNLRKPKELFLKQDSKEYQNYLKYLEKYKEQNEKKVLKAKRPQALSQTIYKYQDSQANNIKEWVN